MIEKETVLNPPEGSRSDPKNGAMACCSPHYFIGKRCSLYARNRVRNETNTTGKALRLRPFFFLGGRGGGAGRNRLKREKHVEERRNGKKGYI